MRHRRSAALVSAVLLTVLAGCGGGTTLGNLVPPSAAGATSQATEPVTPEPSAQASAPTAPAFKDITLKGKGKKVAKFKKPADTAAIALITHKGKSNIIIDSIDASGDEIKGLVNEIGNYKGTVLFDEHDGDNSVALKIDADGSWTITIKPVTSARAWNPATTLSGAGDDVVLVKPQSSGLVTLDLAYKGKSNFIVDAYSQDGSEGIANEIGNFSGQVLLPDGTFLLEVQANGGTWSATPG